MPTKKQDTTTSTTSAASDSKQFRRKAAIALASYSLKRVKQGDSIFIRIDSDITTKVKMNKEGTAPVQDEDGKDIMISSVMVTDLNTGEQGEMVVPFIVKKAFDHFAANADGIVGHAFELVKGKLTNRTNEWSVFELEEV